MVQFYVFHNCLGYLLCARSMEAIVSLKKKYASKNVQRCSVQNCLVQCPNNSDIYMHTVKPEWLEGTVQWRVKKPRYVCDLHFLQSQFKKDFVLGRKRNRLKAGAKPLTE